VVSSTREGDLLCVPLLKNVGIVKRGTHTVCTHNVERSP